MSCLPSSMNNWICWTNHKTKNNESKGTKYQLFSFVPGRYHCRTRILACCRKGLDRPQAYTGHKSAELPWRTTWNPEVNQRQEAQAGQREAWVQRNRPSLRMGKRLIQQFQRGKKRPKSRRIHNRESQVAQRRTGSQRRCDPGQKPSALLQKSV